MKAKNDRDQKELKKAILETRAKLYKKKYIGF